MIQARTGLKILRWVTYWVQTDVVILKCRLTRTYTMLQCLPDQAMTTGASTKSARLATNITNEEPITIKL